jgi:oligosaccharide repeat unit polymerase
MGGGFGFSVVAEGFWEFGLIGCVFYGFLTGFFSERIYQIFLATKHNEIYLFLYALIFSRIVILIHRSGLFSSIKAALIVSIPILFIILIYQLHKFYKKINEDTVGS